MLKSARSASKFVFTVGIAFGVSSVASALTLDEAVSSARENSPDLKGLRLEVQSASFSETRALAGHLPKLDFSAHHLLSERFEELELAFNGANIVIPAIQPYTSLGIGASIELFGGFRTMNEVNAARYGLDAKRHQLSRMEQQTHNEIRTLFYKALGSQVLVEVADQNIQTLENHMKDVNSRVRGGLSTRFDTLRVEVQIEEARTERLAAANNVITNRARLYQAIGITDDTKALEGKLPEDFGHYDVATMNLKDIVREDREAQLLAIQRNNSMIQASRSHWYPNISLFGSHEWYNNYNASTFESDERFKTAYSVGLSLKWNLYDGSASRAAEQQALLEKQMAEVRLGRLDQSLPVDIEESKNRLSYDIATFKAKLSSVRKAEEAVRLAKGAMRAGALTNTEVLDVVLDLNRAKAAAVKSQIDAVDAIGQLELALGRTL